MGENGAIKMIVLASQSPRRKELFRTLGVPFVVRASNVSEDVAEALSPQEAAKQLALRKADAVARDAEDCIVVGSDTIVALDGRMLGKPSDEQDAKCMLRAMRGKQHRVVTGLAVLDTRTGKKEVVSKEVIVIMRQYTDRDIEEYVASGEPMDKAGSYAIQGKGRTLIESYEGCFNAVVGLPLCEVSRILNDMGVSTHETCCNYS